MSLLRSCALALIVLPLTTLTAATTQATEVENWSTLRKEVDVSTDVLAAALRRELGDELNVNAVEGQYLAQQGVLFSLTLSEPWLVIDQNSSGTQVHIDADLDLEEIPRMVHDILAELQINVTPYEAEDLSELRELRQEQRELRAEQRELRSLLRKARRELIRAREADRREHLEQQIEAYQTELAASDEAYAALDADIEAQYDRLKSPDRDPRQKSDALDADLAVSAAVCDAAATLKSLDSEHYVTVTLRQGGSMKSITYRMEHVTDCREGKLDPSNLLANAWVYEDR